jgi:hypothetical protein
MLFSALAGDDTVLRNRALTVDEGVALRRSILVRVTAGLVAAGAGLALSSPGAAAPSGVPTGGTVKVVMTTPDGVPGSITMTGRAKLVAGKVPAGTSATVTLAAPAGAYVAPPPVTVFDGVRYVGFVSTPIFAVRAGQTTTVKVAYKADGGARELHVNSLGTTSVSLAWSAPAGSAFVLRRTPGTTPVSLRTLGVGVPVKGLTATDSTLKPGAQYTYSLFTFNRFGWSGPLAVVVRASAPATDGVKATYVAAPTTLLAKAGDIASATTTGAGVRLNLSPQTPTPLPGAGVVLPISDALPGGFLGVVTAISPDGRTLDLRAGALIDAFDYYEVNIPDFSFGTPGATAQKKSAIAGQGATRGPKAKAQLKAEAGCSGSIDTKIGFAPSRTIGGHFATKVDKYHFLGADIPTGASLDLGVTLTLTGAASIETQGTAACGLDLGSDFHTLVADPVPLSIRLESSADFTVGGGVSMENVGLTASAGFQVNGSLSVKNGASLSASTTKSATPLTPKVVRNGAVGFKVGGALTIGPGVGTKEAGVIAGVSGELDPLDAKVQANFPENDPRFNECTKIDAAETLALGVAVKAWLSKWSFSEVFSPQALNFTLAQYGNSPWYFPSGCQNEAPEQNKDSLLGDGVTKVDDSTIGGLDQWGHVDGFAPGQKTWVLSTGKITDALGTPGQFASTDLGRDGDDALSTLAGYPTFDAAAYTVTLNPAGKTLHVKYVFASEEYPEYVGSAYNDVMSITVGGKNCAVVPGTDTPVAVNTVNAGSNSDYYVDNTDGAAGYSTSMDGLTVPLTCSVPVTPGQPVTVRIAVADTSDHVYDSAVALVDGGIWTD